MKIYNLNQFNEKLKINSVKVDDFDKINPYKIYNSYRKENLKTGDFVLCKDGTCGFIIIEGDVKLNIYDLGGYYKSIILLYDESRWKLLHLNCYNDILNYNHCNDYNIIKVIPNAISIETLNQYDTNVVKDKLQMIHDNVK